MPKVIAVEDLNQIVESIGRYPNGVGLNGLMKDIPAELQRRTLQRRLAVLAKQGRIVATGEARAKKYRLAQGRLNAALIPIAVQAIGEVYTPVSPEGATIKAYVRQPRQQRRPVSYDLKFLEAYRPNETFYLPEALRTQLHSQGRSLRLRYRAELTEAVRALVRGEQAVGEAAIRAAIPATVAEEDRARFFALIEEEFRNLHEGNAIRFGLRPLEFAAWKNSAGAGDGRERYEPCSARKRAENASAAGKNSRKSRSKSR